MGPLTTCRLRPIVKNLKKCQLNILEDGVVQINFHKHNTTLQISSDGQEIKVLQKSGKIHSYELENLPSIHWKKYIYAWRFVELVKAKTPKITFHCQKKGSCINSIDSKGNCHSILKCVLMESRSFEATVFDHSKKSKFKISIDDLENEATPLKVQVRDFHEHCLAIEAQMEKIKETTNLECFPLTIGRRQRVESSNDVNIFPNSQSSKVLRSAFVSGIGIASQV